MCLKVFPGGEGNRVGNPIENEFAVEVIDLMLDGTGTEPPVDLLERSTGAIPCSNLDGHHSDQVATDRDAQTTLVVQVRLGTDLFHDRIDEDRERKRRLVWVALIGSYPDDADPQIDTDLIGGNSCSVGVAHGVDHVVDQRLNLGAVYSPEATT